jgi:hypothetical protein
LFVAKTVSINKEILPFVGILEEGRVNVKPLLKAGSPLLYTCLTTYL